MFSTVYGAFASMDAQDQPPQNCNEVISRFGTGLLFGACISSCSRGGKQKSLAGMGIALISDLAIGILLLSAGIVAMKTGLLPLSIGVSKGLIIGGSLQLALTVIKGLGAGLGGFCGSGGQIGG